MATFGTFLFSKELYIMEHEFYAGIAMFIVVTGVVKSVGPAFKKVLDAHCDEEEAKLRNYRTDEINR